MSEKMLFTDLDGAAQFREKVSPGMQLLLPKWCWQATVWYSPRPCPAKCFKVAKNAGLLFSRYGYHRCGQSRVYDCDTKPF